MFILKDNQQLVLLGTEEALSSSSQKNHFCEWLQCKTRALSQEIISTTNTNF